MTIAFIGLGIMGQRMASRLLDKEHQLIVYNRTAGPANELETRGAHQADSAAEAVREADVVFTMLSKPEVVANLAFGQQGFLSAMSPGSVWVDCTTVDPAFSRRSLAEAQKAGIQFLEAPVAGTKPHAEAGQLTFFAAGEADVLEQVRPLLEHMGQKVLHLGGPGMGSSFKMLVNSLLAQGMLAFAETLLLGEKMGLDRGFLLDTLSHLPVVAPYTPAKAEMIRKQDYEAQFPLEWMQKDLHLASLAAYEVGQPLFMANLAKEVYAAASQSGHGRQDFAAVYEHLRQQE